MKKKKLEYKDEYNEKLVDHSEIESAIREERELKLIMFKNFSWSFIKSLLIVIIAFGLFMLLLYYLAKRKAGI